MGREGRMKGRRTGQDKKTNKVPIVTNRKSLGRLEKQEDCVTVGKKQADS